MSQTRDVFVMRPDKENVNGLRDHWPLFHTFNGIHFSPKTKNYIILFIIPLSKIIIIKFHISATDHNHVAPIIIRDVLL